MVALFSGEIEPIAYISDLGCPALLFIETVDQCANALKAGFVRLGCTLAYIRNTRT
jgi:hypothetical protein